MLKWLLEKVLHTSVCSIFTILSITESCKEVIEFHVSKKTAVSIPKSSKGRNPQKTNFEGF